MTKLKVLAAYPPIPEVAGRLKQFDNVTFEFIDPINTPREVPVPLLRDAEVLFATYPPLNFDAMTALRWIQITSSGYDQLLPLKLPTRGIRACNTRGTSDVPIAEWNVAMMINLIRDVRGMLAHQDRRIWDRGTRFQRELRGSVVGFWGYGGIARETARLAKALGLVVHALVRSDIKKRELIYRVDGTGDPDGVLPDRVFTYENKAEFLRSLDFLIVTIPGSGNQGLIGAAELRELPPHAFVLNPARGPIIEEQALIRALQDGWIAGAALDAHYYYPMPADHVLWSMPNVMMTPHISGAGESTRFPHRCWDIFLENVERWTSGAQLINELSADQLRS